ncbi:MAG: hypothetical protein ACKPBU_04860, partial [Alphaproteobacteria bacterium]
LSDYHGISRRRIEIERGEAAGGGAPAVRLVVIDETARAAAPVAAQAGGAGAAPAPAGAEPR